MIRLGVSACLLGQRVRYDGGHRRSRLLEQLGQDVTWVPVCPEMEIGLPSPRPPIRLVVEDTERLVERAGGTDHTRAMDRFALDWVRQNPGLHGMVLEARSPSCGIVGVKRHHSKGPLRDGTGRFTRTLQERLPWLPLIDDGRIRDPGLREHFLGRAMGVLRLESMQPGTAGLQQFHADNKYLLLSHNQAATQALGRFAAAGNRAAYLQRYHEALARRPTRRSHTNVLQHIAGFLKRDLDEAGRAHLASAIAEYHAGLVPLVAPLAVLRFLVATHDLPWLSRQSYLDPYPREWMLRNHI